MHSQCRGSQCVPHVPTRVFRLDPIVCMARVISIRICSYILVKSEILEILMSGKSTKSEWSAKNPFFTNISDNFVLNGESSKKETRHIVFNLGCLLYTSPSPRD